MPSHGQRTNVNIGRDGEPLMSVNWKNAIFLTSSPILALSFIAFYISRAGIHVIDFACFYLMILLTGLSITAGYHRYFSHRSYECHRAVKLFYLLFGAAALQAPILNWVSDHRAHHRFVDQEEDPYNINKGFMWAHIGWTFRKDIRPRNWDNVLGSKLITPTMPGRQRDIQKRDNCVPVCHSGLRHV